MTAFVLKRIQANGLRGPEPLKYVRLSQVFALQMKQLQPPGRTQLSLGDLATKRERQLTTTRANQASGLTNGRAANWAPEVVFSPCARFPVVN